MRRTLKEQAPSEALVLHSLQGMILPDLLLLIGVAMVVYYGLILVRAARRDER